MKILNRLCLPVDNDRPLGELEMAFFEHATAGVPVIAIFTKFEWRITKAYDQLRDDGKNIVQSRREAPAKALIDFGEIQNQRFANVPNPPAAYVFLQGSVKLETTTSEMNTDSGSSEQLTQITRQLVENKVNQQLFSEIKHNSIKITMAISLVHAIVLARKTELAAGPNSQVKDWTIFLLSLFPYWFAEKEFKLINNPSTPSVDKIIAGCLSWAEQDYRKDLQLLTYFIGWYKSAVNSIIL
ncbi:hypothetical protein D9757_013014 [Collybiopsis confluens]|uniref:Uncharacterized protein n=1 Tax=Collybiopsis confluens TaxID=2823264 RepID=A0A8H5G391_9AGAR|nr:hypothetical protein D9757_013014 [Collybiopsis confluens]